VNDWLSTGHLLGLLVWGGSCLGIIQRSVTQSPENRLKDIHLFGAVPGAFLFFFTGVWMAHEEPQMLREWLFHIKLLSIAGLMIVHGLCVHRFLDQVNPQGQRPIFFITATLLAGCIVLTTLVSSTT